MTQYFFLLICLRAPCKIRSNVKSFPSKNLFILIKITKMITSTTVTVLKVIYYLEIRKFCIYQVPVSVYLVIRVGNLTSLTSGL